MSWTRLAFVLALAALLLAAADSRPAVDEEPTKFSLDTLVGRVEDAKDAKDSAGTEKPVISQLNSRLREGMEIVSETRNNVAGAIGAASDLVGRGRSTVQSFDKTPLAQFFPPRTRETVRLENSTDQAILEKKKTGNPIGTFLENILKPRPIVDNIKEEDKYGNNGDKFIGVGRALVNGFEGLSNFLNAVVDLPLNAAKKTSRGITEALNQIGSRLVGLQ